MSRRSSASAEGPSSAPLEESWGQPSLWLSPSHVYVKLLSSPVETVGVYLVAAQTCPVKMLKDVVMAVQKHRETRAMGQKLMAYNNNTMRNLILKGDVGRVTHGIIVVIFCLMALVSLVFGTAIPTSFSISMKMFSN